MRALVQVREVPTSGPFPMRAGMALPRGAFWPDKTSMTINGAPRRDVQVDELALWEDGSLAHVVFHWLADRLQPGEALFIDAAPVPPALCEPWRPLGKDLLKLFDVRISVLDTKGIAWTLQADAGAGVQVLQEMLREQSVTVRTHLRDYEALVPLRAIGDHPQLMARLRISIASEWPGYEWELLIENCTANSMLQDVDYEAIEILWAGESQFAPRGQLLAGKRLRFTGTAGKAGPRYDVSLMGPALEDLWLSPCVDWQRGCSVTEAEALYVGLQAERAGNGPARGVSPASSTDKPVPGSSFPLYMAGGATGDRADIGALPLWTIAWLQGGSQPACALQAMADMDGSCAFPIHWRDPASNELGVRPGQAFWKAAILPRAQRKSQEDPDIAHHALVGLMTYIATGNKTALEELRCWALLAMRWNFPNDGTLQTMGDRREAWALRTISVARVFDPNPAFNVMFEECLKRTAAEWQKALPRTIQECPLGNLSVGSWSASGRKQSPTSYVGSMWQQAWFLYGCLMADELMGEPLFRPIVEHGWRWWASALEVSTGAQSWADPNDDSVHPALVDLVDYSTPVGVYEPEITPAGAWAPKAKTWRPIKLLGEVAFQRRIYVDYARDKLGAAHMPSDPRPEYWTPLGGDFSTAPSSAWFEYAFGRCGLGPAAIRAGLESAVEVQMLLGDLVRQDHNSRGRPSWAMMRLAI